MARPLRLLVAEGNVLDMRRQMAAMTGATASESYAAVLRMIAPEAHVDICCPADDDAGLAAPLEAYDGIAVTGSSLNIHKREPGSLRQIDFAREIFARGVPMFGSCWGLQLATVAAGGEVATNPRGREVAFARKVTLTEAGRAHPLHAGRDAVYDAPAIHADEVVRPAENTIVTASNAMSQVQAAEIRHGRGIFWGVQYHPEYRLPDVAAIIRRYGQRLVDDGFFPDMITLENYAADLERLAVDGSRRDIAWRFGLGDEILREDRRICEIANWVDALIRPHMSARGRQ
jgi:GMP synthase (glutamine-hydrolysing)